MGWTSDEEDFETPWEQQLNAWESRTAPDRYITGDTKDKAKQRALGPGIYQPSDTMPLILDTALGSYPGDALALLVAATYPQLKLVITADDPEGRRGRLARWFLDVMGRRDVEVTVGVVRGRQQLPFVMSNEVPEKVAVPPRYPVPGVVKVLVSNFGQVRWLGLSTMANLATVLDAIGDNSYRFRVSQLGGVPPGSPIPPDDNLALDAPAVKRVLEVAYPSFKSGLIADRTELRIDTDGPIDRLLAQHPSPGADLVTANIMAWRAHQERPADARELTALAGLFTDLSFADEERGYLRVAFTGSRLVPSNAELSLGLFHEVDPNLVLGWLAERLAVAEGMRSEVFRRG
ncbi:MAG TPA: hypothetical protein VHU91_10705 [Mycobacteriales bacterium]|nr:hypothetical protein [Mycobacteriales bacterium]